MELGQILAHREQNEWEKLYQISTNKKIIVVENL